jgi:hypothetical protein
MDQYTYTKFFIPENLPLQNTAIEYSSLPANISFVLVPRELKIGFSEN